MAMSIPFAGADRQAPLEAMFAHGLDARAVEITEVQRLSGGAVQENWAVSLCVSGGDHDGRLDVVMRTDASVSIESSLSRVDEFHVLRAAWDVGVRVPEPLFVCEDEGLLGRPFYVMRRIPGVATAHRLVRSDIDGDALVAELGTQLGRLHSLRPPWPGLEFLQVPDMRPAQFRVETYRGYLDGISSPQPTLEWALGWLARHAPRDETLVLCHGDFRTGNYLVDDGRLSGILDWEFAAFSDPLEDLGWFCARCWRFGRDHLEAGGMGSREALCLAYEGETGARVDRGAIAYWEIMATARWALIALQQGERHMRDEHGALEPALTAHIVPELELDLLDQIENHARSAA